MRIGCRVVCIGLVVALAVASFGVFAVGSGYFDGYEDGRRAAEQDHNGTLQFGGGFLLGVLYLGYAALSPGQAPEPYRIAELEGRSDEYRQGFMEGYETEWKRLRTNNALFGAAASTVAYILFYMWLLAL